MSEALRILARPEITEWEPALTMSNKTNVDSKATKDKQNELKQKIECDSCLKRKNLFQENKHKACSDL